MFYFWLVEEGAVVRMLDRRRFPAPWFVEETPACFIVRDRAGQALAHLYYEASDGRSAAICSRKPRHGGARQPSPSSFKADA